MPKKPKYRILSPKEVLIRDYKKMREEQAKRIDQSNLLRPDFNHLIVEDEHFVAAKTDEYLRIKNN